MKFITVSVLTVGATLTGVLAAPIMTGGDIANLAAANMVSTTLHLSPHFVRFDTDIVAGEA